MERAARLTGDECLGARFAEALPVGATGVYGFLLANARTLREALQVTKQYVSLVMEPIEIDLEIGEEQTSLNWSLPLVSGSGIAHYQMFTITALILRLRAVAGLGWAPERIEIAHREMQCADTMRRILGTQVHFNAAKNAIVMETASLDRKSAIANPELFEIIRSYGDDILERRESDGGVVREARRAISASLGVTDVTLETVASALGLPPRTLQQRLGQAGTTFEGVLQDTRRSLASQYLRDTDLSMTEIAYILGFSELSSFTRAAMRWYGHAPSVERQTLIRGAATGENVQ